MLGTKIGQYRIVRKIGQGGMGVVYEAQHQSLKLRAAVKVLRTEGPADPAKIERFFAEARAVSTVQHSSLVRLFDFGTLKDGTVFMMMEYLSGEPLSSRLVSGPLPGRLAVNLARQIAAALCLVHGESIIHRDLKPANVMVVPDGEAEGGERAKLLDFGIARFLDSVQDRTSSGTILGTPRYMSPEQFASSAELDERTDVYSMAILLYEMLTGKYPYEVSGAALVAYADAHLLQRASSLRHFLPTAPVELNALLAAMLDKDPSQRPDMASVVTQLRPWSEPGSWADAPLSGSAPRPVAPPSPTETGSAAVSSYDQTALPADSLATPRPPPTAPGVRVEPDSPPSAQLPGEPVRLPERAAPRWSKRRLLLAGTALGVLLLGGYGVARRHVAALGAAPSLPPATVAGMIWLPGGTYDMGSTSAEIEAAYQLCVQDNPDCSREPFEREQPVRRVTLSPFYLDKTEVTNRDYAAWLNKSYTPLFVKGNRLVSDGSALLVDLHPEQSGLQYENARFIVRPGFADKPVVQVSWTGARSYCTSRGHDLPSEAQWESAARGENGRGGPWPFGAGPPRCADVVFARARGLACAHLGRGPAAVGTAAQDRTARGVMDLAGNIEEWVLDSLIAPYPDCGSCKNPVVLSGLIPGTPTSFRVTRGGSWSENASGGRIAGRSRWKESYVSTGVGFRCAANVSQ